MTTTSDHGCTICRHPRLAEINSDLEDGLDDLRVAQKFECTRIALRRHIEHAGLTIQGPRQAAVIQIRPGNGGCAICVHPKVVQINQAILARQVPTRVARTFFLDTKVVRDHASTCIAHLRETERLNAHDRCLAMVQQAEELLDEVSHDDDASYGDKAKMLAACNQLIVSLGRFTGELSNATELVIIDSPKWRRIEAALSQALSPFPAAAEAAAKALQELDAA